MKVYKKRIQINQEGNTKVVIKKWPVLMAVCLIIPVVLLVISAIGTSAKGAELIAIEQKIAEFDKENRYLKEKIVAHSSLTELIKEVDEQQYSKPAAVVYLNHDTSVAQR